MPTMPLAQQIMALLIVLPPVFVVSLLLVFFGTLLTRNQGPVLAPVKPARNRVAVAAKDRDLADRVRSRHPEHI